MAASMSTVFVRVACFLLLSSSYSLQRVVGDDRCSGERHCDLEAACYFSVNVTSTLHVVYQLNQTTENQAIRVLVSSREAVSAHPLLVTVKQPHDITSWTVPYTESGYSYFSVERTLCPLNNRDDDPEAARLLIDVSTSSPTTVNFSLSTSIVDNFYLTLNEPVTITASPSKPAYLQFSYPLNTTKVKVLFSSNDNTSHICAIASIQSTYCPVVELLDNPDHRGTYQTMRSKAAINTRLAERPSNSSRARPSYGYFYAVVTVLPSNEDFSTCFSEGRSATDHLVTSSISSSSAPPTNTYLNPIELLREDERKKQITITVVPALSDSQYAVAIVTATLLYMAFYFIALIWIYFSDYICYRQHPLIKFMERKRQKDRSETCRAGEAGGGNKHGENDETNEVGRSVEETDFVCQDRTDTSGSLIKNQKTLPNQRYTPMMDGKQEYPETPIKRPSLCCVLIGRHWTMALSKTHSSSSHQSHDLRLEEDTSDFRPLQSINGLHDNNVDGANHSYHGDGTTGVRSHMRKDSYEEAVDEGRILGGVGVHHYKCDTELLPVNLYISELDILCENKDTLYTQKHYDHLWWYMVSIIIFYGLPAFQLVIGYQQLLNISGNEDICYYNSLCSHPWTVSGTLTISALNNIISNIGYFILGSLFILIAHRRRTMYKAFEKVNRNLSWEKMLGVPQYFGIYYAIGLVLMAEAFMSAAYHICPSNANYQFDTTFMFILASLGLFKLLASRSPDHNPPLYKMLFLQATIIVLAAVGVIYYRWQLDVKQSFVELLKQAIQYIHKKPEGVHDVEGGNEGERTTDGEREEERTGDNDQVFPTKKRKKWTMMQLFKMYKKEGLFPPKHKPKFATAILSNLVNWILALCMVGLRPLDFGTSFLMILIINFLLYLFCYAITKCIYKEIPTVALIMRPLTTHSYKEIPSFRELKESCRKDIPSFRPLGFLILSLIFWIVGVYSYLQGATDWLQPPAVSRDSNRDCAVLYFFDSHDLWHFCSAFGLFFSFLMLMSLDDRQEGWTRDRLRVF